MQCVEWECNEATSTAVNNLMSNFQQGQFCVYTDCKMQFSRCYQISTVFSEGRGETLLKLLTAVTRAWLSVDISADLQAGGLWVKSHLKLLESALEYHSPERNRASLYLAWRIQKRRWWQLNYYQRLPPENHCLCTTRGKKATSIHKLTEINPKH